MAGELKNASIVNSGIYSCKALVLFAFKRSVVRCTERVLNSVRNCAPTRIEVYSAVVAFTGRPGTFALQGSGSN